jgi:hypothetical protein
MSRVPCVAVVLVLSAVVFAQAQKKAVKPTAEKPAPVAKPAVKAAEPASPDQAAKVLDLRTFPVMDGAKVSDMRTLGMLMYEIKAAPPKAFEFQRAELKKRGFQELKGGYADAMNVSGNFTKDGFYVRVSASANADVAYVSVINDGNVAVEKLPVPPGVKPFYPQAYRAAYTTDLKVPEASAACRKLLSGAGWEPYGQAGTNASPAAGQPESLMHDFKKNAIKLKLWVQHTPNDGGKTLIQYDTELLSADIPCPPDTADPRYTDPLKTLNFDSPKEQTESILAFYQERLPKMGWKATTEKPVSDDRDKTQFLIFRNAAKELLSLDLKEYTDIVRVQVRHQTAAELAEEERQAKELAAKRKAEQAERDRKFPVAVPALAKAKKLEKLRENVWEFTVATGTCPAEMEFFRKHYLKEGWTEDEGTTLERNSGEMSFKKDKLELWFSYLDSGFGDAEIKVSGSYNVILEDANAKDPPKSDKPPTGKPAAEKPKAKTPGIPGLPELPPGVELPDDVKAEVEKALKEAEKALPKKPAPPKK